MSTQLRAFAILALPIVGWTASLAAAGVVVSSRTLVCGGTGPKTGSIMATESGSTLTLRARASGLIPNIPVTCGYNCEIGSGAQVSCGSVSETGRFSGTVELPLTSCFGLRPFFTTGDGRCQPSTAP
jgi:hypothetical protein